MGAKSLGERLGISKDEANQLYDQYFSSYSAISVWVDRVTQLGKKRGYSLSKFGRRFTIWELQSSEGWIYAKGERLCVNAPIQGGAADYMKIAMVRADKALRKAGLHDQVHMIMNVHDALYFEAHRSVHPQTIINCLQPAVVFPVEGWPKMITDWSIGVRWGGMKKIKLDADGNIKLQAKVEDENPFEEGDEDTPAAPLPDVKAVLAAKASPPSPSSPSSPATPLDISPDNGPVSPRHLEGVQRAVEAGALASITDQPARHLIVEITEMPSESQYTRWLDFVAQSRGPNSVCLRTPEGELEYDGFGTALTPDDAPRISLIFNGARAYYMAEDVDASAVFAGLDL